MGLQHRNSQKRFYVQDAVYFITAVTQDRYPYFKESILCDLFVENLKICKQFKSFKLFGWFLGYDHCHLLFQPGDLWNYSQVMHNLKRITSLHINQIIEGEDIYPRLQFEWTPRLDLSRNEFIHKYSHGYLEPKFKWQRSFHDHYIRNHADFMGHLEYIAGNPVKHQMPADWFYIFTNQKYQNSIDEF